MGCDIHAYLEKKMNNIWVCELDFDKDLEFNGIFSNRNYDWFGWLAGVRKHHILNSLSPRGMPCDASERVKSERKIWYYDGHSASWEDCNALIVRLHKTLKMYEGKNYIALPNISKMTLPEAQERLFARILEPAPHRVVYWFDN